MSYLEKNPNRLINEDSPYLLQHAYNPVDWYAWGDEAFARARAENKPIFLSIGYSACHWCHVMEREVFENEELASLLNELFVSVKVDREERPDIDKHFQHIHYIITRRSGGWPTSIFLTPDKKPFFAATYLPPKAKHGMMGFGEVASMLAKKLQDEPQEVYGVASNIERIAKRSEIRAPASSFFDLFPPLKDAVIKSFDKEDGGIAGEPKFPHTALLTVMLKSEDEELISTALLTLKRMARGGMYDIVEGGFCRYSVDSFWFVPHFEKMTYDNGLLTGVYAEAYGVSQEPLFLRIAKECADFMLTKMCEGGVFYSASDADSDGAEGKYFVYGWSEAVSALEKAGLKNPQDYLKKLGFGRFGNWEGKNIAKNEEFDDSEEISQAIKVLRDIRSQRAYPFIDKKIICSWNAMVISGLLGLAKYDKDYAEIAKKSIEGLFALLYKKDVLYHCAMLGKNPKIEAFLEDYAYLATAFMDAYALFGDEKYKQRADSLLAEAVDRYFKAGSWMMSSGEFETKAEAADSSYPSPVGVICLAMCKFGDKYRQTVQKTIDYYFEEASQNPMYYAALTEVCIIFENKC